MKPRETERDAGRERRVFPGLGKLLNRLPRRRLFYPLYLTDQLLLCRETVYSPRVPEEFDGFRFGFLSDIHYGPLFSGIQRDRLLAFFEACRGADALLMGGDYGMNLQEADSFFKAFELPRFSQGIFAVAGNHEAFGASDDYNIAQILKARDIKLLDNASVLICRGRAALRLTGLRDFFAEERPVPAPVAREPDVFDIILTHNPDRLVQWKRDRADVVFDLCLCGHTHGGQVAVFGHSVISSCRYGDVYRSGWYEVFGGRLLVTDGVGTSKLPVRLGAPPQAHLITLKKSDSDKTDRKTTVL